MREFNSFIDARGTPMLDAFLAAIPAKDANRIALMLQGLVTVERLGQPYFKRFAGYPFWFGELILGAYRIFIHRLSAQPGQEVYLMVHAFRKKTNETPQAELDAATRNIIRYYEAQN
ncbi:MAG: type II toxin-antitoxin system RelE/ParE family toxin [Hymenobacteraceae bacterium]|nr:type II toxin-antitoxin system RelE/ParE family toxin [Hymenobacteraceae bacterium]